ncbi:MAG: OmcA/MtrC family decaheme c-type cytochrome [Myxococcota bacterium]
MRFQHFLVSALVAASIVGCAGPTGPAGAPCKVSTDTDGNAVITCPDGSSTVIKNGTNGTSGTNGTNGTNGTDGISCSVFANPDAGTKVITCSDGTSVVVTDGKNGTNGTAQGSTIAEKHGRDVLVAEAASVSQKSWVKVNVTAATASAAGEVVATFSVTDANNRPVTSLGSVTASISKLLPPGTGEVSSRWVSYIYRVQTVTSAGDWPGAIGTWAYQGNRESNGTLTNNGDGTYTYRFATNLSSAAFPDGGAAISYERNRLHRVSIMLGGATGPTGSGEFDFVPDGSASTLTRNIVETATCQNCHGPTFALHGGDRMTVANCTTCHDAQSTDPHSGNTIDFTQMIHKIHAGGELTKVHGPDGKVFDNPATPVDESADNGEYAIWGFGNAKHEWSEVEFPAVLSNCTACHTGSGANVDAWKTNPSRKACGSCHDDIDFATGANHAGGAATTDTNCALCHPATGTTAGIIHPVPDAHDWLKKDLRNQPEFNVTMAVSTPANGTHFVAGEKPRITVRLAPSGGGTLDHTALLAGGAAVGCAGIQADGGWDGTCATAADNNLSTPNLFVHGPRARNNPVGGTIARAEIISPSAAGNSFTIAAGSTLTLTVDNGQDVRTVLANGQDKLLLSTFSVPVPTAGFTNATQTDLMNWLNGNATFAARAIAYMDEASGRLAIRSRNLGRFFSVQLAAGPVTTAVFGGNTAIQAIGGYYAANNLVTDPKVTKFADRLEYELDAVDDLKPGTYVAQVELSDRGRVNETNYRTPSVKWVTFQVKQADVEKPVASGCASCHQNSTGSGFVLDWSRHNKLFGNDAVDQCAGCHDYQAQSAIGGWSGGGALTRRVHAVHAGSALNFPLLTVGYSNGDPVAGRNWNITFPQPLRSCEACHTKTGTSDAWKKNPTRLACGGCHDSESASAHLSAMTFDPTPANPYSGDEQESCATCHAP